MKIYHIRKESGKDTDFRPTILRALTAYQNYKSQNVKSTVKVEVYIASGFFTEDTNIQNPSNVSTFTDLSTSTQLISALHGFDKIYLFGAYSGKKELQNLVTHLRSFNLPICGYYQWHFHAKIFIITVNGETAFEIIGSSNMTNSAYNGLKSLSKYSQNFETDLVLCRDDICNVPIDTNEKIMQFRYFPEDNNGITIKTHMEDILNILKDHMRDETKPKL